MTLRKTALLAVVLRITLGSVRPVSASEFVLSDIPADKIEKMAAEGSKKMGERFKQPDPSHLPYMTKLATRHALSHIMPETHQYYGIVVPEGYSLVPNSIKPVITNLSLVPDSFDLRQILYQKDGKQTATRYYTYLAHVKYQVKFAYEIEKGTTREKRETRSFDMETHHYVFPESALKELFALLKIESLPFGVINGDMYMNPLIEQAPVQPSPRNP